MDVNDVFKNMESAVNKKRDFFASGRTTDLSFRREQLIKISKTINKSENEIYQALNKDLGRSQSESYLAELLSIKSELAIAIKNLNKWAKKRDIKTSLMHMPAKSYTLPEPYGVVLIISPWNYPLSLSLIPAISAIAAGNCVIIKPSEYSQNTTELLSKLIGDYFESSFIEVITGGPDETKLLLQNKFDYIFYTGGEKVAKSVMLSAAEHLTPLTLELGGKSPCIFHSTSDLKSAAKRIVWGKFFNAGQTCVAPDYLLIPTDKKDELVNALIQTIKDFYGENAEKSESYSKIINEKHMMRLTGLLKNSTVLYGGDYNISKRYISPTIIDDVSWDSEIMEEEIFGPILPIIYYKNISEVISKINSKPKPLALYIFSNDEAIRKQILNSTYSGGVCINDAVIQVASPYLPFGGVGTSGMGSYHGKTGFDTFSHLKSVMERKLGFDAPFRFPPYQKFSAFMKQMFDLMG